MTDKATSLWTVGSAIGTALASMSGQDVVAIVGSLSTASLAALTVWQKYKEARHKSRMDHLDELERELEIRQKSKEESEAQAEQWKTKYNELLKRTQGQGTKQ